MNYKIVPIGPKFEIQERIPDTSVFLKANISGVINSFSCVPSVMRCIKAKLHPKQELETYIKIK